jgi:ABC-type phosphate transport system substrate-binding protein
MNKQILKMCLMLIGLGLSVSVWAGDVVVIVNKDNDNAINKALVAKIYRGQMRQWSGGEKIILLDLPESSPTRESFSSDIVGKSESSLKYAWAQLMFSGAAVPPKEVQSDEEMKKYVSDNKNAIGYIKASSLDSSVKAVVK